ncbi:MAG: PLP-dependent transferase, partial [Streptococcaceae bacterium]|nr:PLP-dependent transferase [Streptococcaceae bacterium]
YQINQGAILSPFDAYSLIRGIKTLAIRLDRQAENTQAIIDFLTGHQAIETLYFAGSFSDDEQAIQARQASGIGAVISFSLKPTYCVKNFLSALEHFDLAASLGGVESLIEHVVSMSHQSFSQESLEKLGITQQLVRLAVGIENKKDLIADLKQALNRAEKEV